MTADADARMLLAASCHPHHLRFFRLSSSILPWMSKYDMAELPQFEDISAALAQATIRRSLTCILYLLLAENNLL
jgi:UV DNA damage repair endonuclease